ncbi:MAG: FAD-linked oxidoreductase [Acidimicrobiaceae bacterium]|nr:FAD-linked oxidoreductase [Acidimicrobiaceae bacterium]
MVSNWARNQRCVPDAVHQPASTDEVARIVRQAHEAGQRVKVIGAGHSFTATAMTDGVMLRLDNMGQILNVDGETGQVHVQAGATLHDFCRELHRYGLALPNLGDIDVQSIAGAISTATHGTGFGLGNLATNVVAMTLVSGKGEIVELNEGDSRMSIAAVGVGALGIVCEVVLQCVPSFRLHAYETIEYLDDLLDDIPSFAESADHAEFFWMPGARRCQVKRNQRTTEDIQRPGKAAYFRDKYVAENLAFGTVCRVGRRWPSLAPRIAKLVSSSVSERDLIDDSFRVFASPRLVRFVEMEYGIPIECLPEAVQRVREVTKHLSFPSLFPIEVRVSAADDIALSTGFGRLNGWVAVHQYVGAPYESYFQQVADIMDSYGGRPHWGKMHYLKAAQLCERYPRWGEFQELRATLDPDGIFRNEYVDRVLGVPNAK